MTAVGGIGGGYGDPRQRPPELVREDVLDGYITPETAAELFGVALNEDFRIDMEKTMRLRADDR